MKPAVTICIPVRNEEARIQKVIESSLRQTYRPLEILVLDNGSTDNTLQLSSASARKSPEIQLHSHSTNIGGWPNFIFGLSMATGEYFSWLAADDSKSPNFIASCVDFLDANPDYEGVTGLEHFGDSIRTSKITGEDREARIQEFFDVSWESNGLIYGVFRTRTLKAIPTSNGSYFAVDWTTLLWILLHGKIGRLVTTSLDIGTGGRSNGPQRFTYPQDSWQSWLRPFNVLQREVLLWPDWSARERRVLRKNFFRKDIQAVWWKLVSAVGDSRRANS